MSTVREKIIDALTLFYTAIKSKFVLVGNVVNNCASTSTTYPLAANQGTQLQNQIDELNSNFAKFQHGTMVISFSNGTAVIDLKDSAGKSYKPDALIITLETNTGSIVYDWDNSFAGNILLSGRTYSGTGYAGVVRIAYIAVIP